jgi:hypothetical protein
MMLSLACDSIESVGLPSVVMWDDRGEDRCCGLSKVGMVETFGFCQVMWIVMLESAKDRVLEVDILGLQVLPYVWYRTAYLLIRDAVENMSCSDEWELA